MNFATAFLWDAVVLLRDTFWMEIRYQSGVFGCNLGVIGDNLDTAKAKLGGGETAKRGGFA